MQKAQGEISPLASAGSVNGQESADGPVIHEDGTVVSNKHDSTVSNSTTLAEDDADDDASTRGVVSSRDQVETTSSASSSTNLAEGIPTIRISAESTRKRDDDEASEASSVNGEAKQNGVDLGDTLEKPVQAAAGEAGEGAQHEPPSPNAASESFSFSNKRLCERWLDNLFMVLYEVCPFFLLFSRLLTAGLGSTSVDYLPS